MAAKVISSSIVFDHNGPDFLTRTPGAPTDATTWTFSCWVKIGSLGFVGNSQPLLSAGTGVNDNTTIFFSSGGSFFFRHEVATVVVDQVSTQGDFLRDPTAWYHIVVTYDSNEAVAADRIKFWSNGRKVEEFNSTNFPTSAATSFIDTAVEHRIGTDVGAIQDPSRGYMSDVYFVDGLALTPTTFGELVDDSWQPIAASPTFGANGFLLEFGDDLELGDDTSGNTNDFTESSITAANQREDTPTQNHVTFNPFRIGDNGFPDPTLEYGNLRFIIGDTNFESCWTTSSLPLTGKYYWEVDIVQGTAVNETLVGVVSQLNSPTLGARISDDNHGWGIRNPSGTVLEIVHDLATLLTFTDTGTIQTGDYVQIAYDADTRELWFGINGTFLDSGDPGAGTGAHITFGATEIAGGALIPAVTTSGTVGNRLDFRAGAEDFEGSIPTGFATLRVDAWPVPVITKPSDFFEVVEWAGDSTASRDITGAAFQPDLAWVKDINNTGRHLISDITKGAGTVHYNHAAIADDAASANGEIRLFNSDGIRVVDGPTNGDDVNLTGRQYVVLMWKEGVLQGLDLVGYVGAAAPQNIAHALTVAPEFMYVRNRDTAAGNEVYFGHTIDGAGEQITDPETDSVQADTTAALTDSALPWDDTAPDASNFRVGSATSTNANTDNHQAYLWANVEGFCKVGSYGGSGAVIGNAPYVYCGFRPKAILIKRLDAVDDWCLLVKDGEFTNFNLDHIAYQHASQFWRSNLAEANQTPVPQVIICGSGFAVRQTNTEINALAEYAFIAWAEVPFKHASASSVVPKNADGAIDLKLQIDATGDLPNQHGDGIPDLGIQIDATGDLPNQHGDGAMDIAIVLEGQGTNVNRHGDGAMDLAIVLDGTGDYPGEFGDGAMDLGIQIDAAGVNPTIHGDALLFWNMELAAAGESGDDGGNIPLPQLQVVGAATQSFPLTGSARIPQLDVVATIDNASVGTGTVRLPQLQTQGEIDGDMDVDLPLLQVVGTIVPGRVYFTDSLGLPIPVLQVVGAGISQQLSVGTIPLPLLRVLGEILPGSVITGSVELPQLQVDGFLFIPNQGTGSILLPALDIDPLSFIAAGSIGGGSVTLPFVRVEGVVVNGVTLTGTVWVMNTETFETTNYLNFDFDSLVSFNEQPYGVTSSGIFLLEGDDDDGTDINARILTGISDRGDENLSEVAQLYLQYEGQSVILQLLPDGQQKIREYEIVRRSNSSGIIHARAKGSRGLRSRSWQMGFRNLSGGDFTFDKMGLLIRQLTRKTRKN